MSDQELRALERRLEAEPEDEALARQYDRALLRAGRVDDAVQLRARRALCDRRWLDHELDAQSGLVRRCVECQRGVTWISDAAELQRYVAAGQPVGGTRELLEAHLREAVARELAAPDAEPSPGPRCYAPGVAQDVVGLRRACTCLAGSRRAIHLHVELQDTACEAWQRLLAAIEAAALDGRATFDPAAELGPDAWGQIVTLPPTIAKLTEVRALHLYGNSLTRLPPEIGEMRSLEMLGTYASYRLHWYPYELTRCRRLRQTHVSTRALYGNFKYRPPFPDLTTEHGTTGARGRCSHCDRPSDALVPVWISLKFDNDVLPLLVNACSDVCIQGLPRPPVGYVQEAHRGGPDVVQPPRR